MVGGRARGPWAGVRISSAGNKQLLPPSSSLGSRGVRIPLVFLQVEGRNPMAPRMTRGAARRAQAGALTSSSLSLSFTNAMYSRLFN